MILRFSVGVLALLMGLALSVGPSGAQYYPPYGPQYLPAIPVLVVVAYLMLRVAHRAEVV